MIDIQLSPCIGGNLVLIAIITLAEFTSGKLFA